MTGVLVVAVMLLMLLMPFVFLSTGVLVMPLMAGVAIALSSVH